MPREMINKIMICVLLAGFVAACKKDELPPQERLFRPVLKGSLESDGNFINVAWEKMKGAVSYTLEISRDSFKTIQRSVTLDSTRYTFQNLLWNQAYRLQVRANAQDTSMNSHFSYLGEIKTPRFPSILNTPGINDILTNKVKVSWVTDGATVTSIKIFKGADSSLAQEVALDAIDVAAKYKIVTGLTPATPYIIFLYSGTSIRGWADFTTTDALSGKIIDLTDIVGRPKVLLDTLPLIDNGSTVLLKKGQVYAINASLALTKSVTISAGDDLLVTEPPMLYFTSNFTFAASSTVEYVRFEKLKMRSDNYGSRYVFNVNAAFNCGEISFASCDIGAFRGITRFQNQAIVVNKYSVNHCKIDSIKDYAILSVDGASALVKDMTLTNSTFWKCEKILVTSKPTGTMNGIVIENNTFMEAALGGLTTATGNTLIDCSNQKFTGNIVFKTNIVGPGWKRDNVIIRGIRPGLGSIDAANNYLTADASIAVDAPIPDAIIYPKTSAELFLDPANGNFKIKDNTFPGKATTGDPRWRP